MASLFGFVSSRLEERLHHLPVDGTASRYEKDGPTVDLVRQFIGFSSATQAMVLGWIQPMPLSSSQPLISEVPTASPLNSTLPQTAMAALWQGHMLEAVKLVRLEQNLGFHEAKEVIDTYLRSQPALKNRIDAAQADAREGLFRWMIFLLVGGVGLGYFLM